ncbi:hypothetical protein SAMN05421736_101247 [Evansella caseinilytica]|uniref:Uncharacterized protein n=1 Tax=Evansella caseinilytica TaxID=1503961 RepID=A0A1H3GQ70_9BACI|nr:hypothetical protein [Evansella caseinilytica]SDY05431.1 hypothetical protein SAMN05421736_101247 [Evansella caseinilytica]
MKKLMIKVAVVAAFVSVLAVSFTPLEDSAKLLGNIPDPHTEFKDI